MGRGLGALIPNFSADEKTKTYVELPLASIENNPDQPRKHFDSESIKELVESIKSYGVVQPIIVRKNGDKYQIIAGERRFRAAKEAGLDKIHAIIKELEDKEAFQISLIENIQREDLDAIEEAKAYHQLVAQYQMTQAELATRLGKSRSTITNSLRLLSLPDEVKKMIIDGHISSGHAKAILSIADERQQLRLAKQIRDDNLSVRDTEKLSKSILADDENLTGHQKKKTGITMKDIGEQLSRLLDAKVTVTASGNKGQIKIFFSSLEEMTSIITKFNEKTA